ncbi:hypothetical protein THASP1DRAFT_31530 [Thamnocephalis sphaerospora]|uniref:Uncharacterized protein n=1 Tax=Thamnocephalis sphaerospora TaxID=78915 RepID=A0A4P9XLC3_9FUNG|nr:hypothetical protein THASP1DRAFT_31530 [Thamnocephalis sphaerospora]|eukprot:RKP06658.1 hypothetical protein THASP1DRAFT_31530 [Thamnocephalis sphaerospora]
MVSRTAAFVCGALVTGGALFYQREYVRSDARMLRRRLRDAGDQLEFALSKRPYVSKEVAAKEHPYEPTSLPNHLLRRLGRIWDNDVVPTWRARWNRQVSGVADRLTSLETNAETLKVNRSA